MDSKTLTLPDLLKRYRLTESSIKKQVTDAHLERISRSYCKEWKRLPSYLHLENIIAEDIDRSPKEEKDKRHDFLLKWKKLEGSDGTYQRLIEALLKINCVQDAEGVCLLLTTNFQSHEVQTGASTSTDTIGGEVQCTYRPCSWRGHNDMLENHYMNCDHKPIPCPNKCKRADDYGIKRALLDHHMKNECPNKDSQCKSCRKRGKYVNIEQHEKTCENVRCDNAECDEIVHRQDLQRHLDTCEYTEVPCKYQRVGCDTKMKRKLISIHEDSEDKEHLLKALDKITSMDQTIEDMGHEIVAMKKIVLTNGSKFMFRAEGTGTSTIPSIYVDGYHMALRIRVTAEGDEQVSVSLTLIKGEHDEILDWPGLDGIFTITLLNTIKDGCHLNRNICITGGQVGKNYECQFSNTEQAQSTKQAQSTEHGEVEVMYSRNGILFFKMSVEVRREHYWLACTTAAKNSKE